MPPLYGFQTQRTLFAPSQTNLLLPTLMGGVSARRRQEDEELREVLPDEKDIAEYVTEQEDEESLLQTILEFPSRAAGFFAITGAIEGALDEGFSGAVEGFARGGIWADVMDALGLTDDFADRKTFRDIRVAAGGRNVDEGFENVVLNILGDIALDPVSWLNPFGVSEKALRNAQSVINPMRRLRRDDIRKLYVSGDKGWLAEESVLALKKREEILAEAVGKGDLVRDMTFIGPKPAASVLEEEKLLAEVVPGLIFDAERGIAREAAGLTEKVQSGLTALATFKVPFFGTEVHKVLGTAPDGIALHTARALDSTAEALRKIPGIGNLMRVFDPSQVAGISAHTRSTLKESQRIRQEVTNAVIAEGHAQMQRLLHSPMAEHVTALEHRVFFDLLELESTKLDDLTIRKVFGEVHAYSRIQKQARERMKDPKVAALLDRAERGDLAAINQLNEANIPLHDWQLEKLGQSPKVGRELPSPVVATSEPLTEAAERAGLPIPETEQVLTRESLITPPGPDDLGRDLTREGLAAEAAAERVERLNAVQARIDNGDYTWDDLIGHAKGLASILGDLKRTEEAAGVLDASLMGYVSRIVDPQARKIIDEVVPQRLQDMGDDVWNVASSFFHKRAFSELSTNEVNLMLNAIGSTATGGNPLEVLHDIFWGNKTVAQKLKQEAPDFLEFITTETSYAAITRVEGSAKLRGRAAMLDVLLDPQMGIVMEITDSRNLAQSLANGTIGREGLQNLVPFIRSGAGSTTAKNPVDIMNEGVSAQTNARAEYVRGLIDEEFAAREAALKGKLDPLVKETQAQKSYNAFKDGDEINPNDPHSIQVKKKATRTIKKAQEDLGPLRAVRPRGGKKAGNRVRARVSRTKGGRLQLDLQNGEFLPDDMQLNEVNTLIDNVEEVDLLDASMFSAEQKAELYEKSRLKGTTKKQTAEAIAAEKSFTAIKTSKPHTIKLSASRENFLVGDVYQIKVSDLEAFEVVSGVLSPPKLSKFQKAGAGSLSQSSLKDVLDATNEKLRTLSATDIDAAAELAADRAQFLQKELRQRASKESESLKETMKGGTSRTLSSEQKARIVDDAVQAEKRRRYKSLANEFNSDIDGIIVSRIEELNQVTKSARGEIDDVNRYLGNKIDSIRTNRKEKLAGIKEDRLFTRQKVNDAKTLSNKQMSYERQIMGAQAHSWGVKAFDNPEDLAKLLENQPTQKVYWMDRDVARGVTDFMSAFSKPDTWKNQLGIFDHFTHWWKRTTVLPFPASRMRDIVSNISLLTMGGFRHTSSFADAWGLSHTYRKWLKGEISDIDEHLKGKVITLSEGKQVPAAQVLHDLRKLGGLDGGYLRDEFQDIALEYAGALNKKIPGKVESVARKVLRPDSKVGKLLDIPVLFGEAPTSAVTKAGMGFSVWGDNFTKLAGYIDGLKRGMKETEAADHVRRFLWSPGSTSLSNTERHVFRRALPFYNWMRFVTGVTADQYFSNPRVFTPFAKARDSLERSMGVSDLPMDILAGQSIAERLGIPIKMGKNGPRYLMFDGYLPHAEIASLAKAVMGVIPGSGVEGKESLTFLGSRLNPLIKEPLEAAINYNLHFQRDIEFFPGEHADFLGLPVGKKALKTIANIRFLKTVNDLNIFNLSDFRVGLGDAVKRMPPGREPRSLLTSIAEFAGKPKERSLNIEAETQRRFTRSKLEAGKLKGALRRRIGDPRKHKQEDVEVLAELYGHRQAEMIRLQRTAEKFGFEAQRKRRR